MGSITTAHVVDVIKIDLDLDQPKVLMRQARDVLDLATAPPPAPSCDWCC